MNYKLRITNCAAAVVVLAAQPTQAASAKQVTGVQLQAGESGFELMLETAGGKERPQIFTFTQGKMLVADVLNTKLNLEGKENRFYQENPFPGIQSVEVKQAGSNNIRVIVRGKNSVPDGEIRPYEGEAITLGFALSGGAEEQRGRGERGRPDTETPIRGDTGSRGAEEQRNNNVMVPNPRVTVDGNPAPTNGKQPTAPTPPTNGRQPTAPSAGNPPSPPSRPSPRAVAPPVGDIGVSNVDSSAALIELETDKRVGEVVLRDAPIREVLLLLARSANFNLVYDADAGGGSQGEESNEGNGEAPPERTISMNLQGVPVQKAFNYVLQISGLEANREKRTIFVAPTLPTAASDIITRTFRLNQVSVSQAAAFLATQGAAAQQVFTEVEQVVNPETQRVIREVEQPSKIVPLTVNQEQAGTASLLLKGLSVSTDERLNSLTLVGEPRKVKIATSLLTQLDARRRQVAVNVKIIDVNLSNTDNYNSSFSFGLGDSFFEIDGGAATLNFGGSPPNTRSDPNRFLSSLEAQVTNGNAKILTDPTLVVQEGQTATVNLTEEVYGGVRVERVSTDAGFRFVREPIIKEAGLILNIDVNQIGDNGFVNLNVNPTVSSIGGSVEAGAGQGEISLLQERTLNSGRIRLRDGQTLVLSGIIQESDQTTVSKVPILGDIPILGALFRSTEKRDQRNEVIVLLTPQILRDSARSRYGYNYTPGREARQMLQERGFSTQENQR
ncbi:MAG: type II and III secretion system protein [Cyanobacteria bacterium SW_4_48_29]|nr:MAG: type II and III secretion system protein [Cyanobacteria bacterium QS_5_48_63]PSO94812.1 MAG: type II and III secretion system protein [Cyanobacteria bacterium SW_6_48_11]PSP04251.1 MAG: type II and III secretion system protein [Cyanobacteria bacterium SW_12_48_29]PSP11134.1 MAG: type II and III secretion system protein [Cyanobacteria bacterium SW_10_48_33]PSP29957.1 MAG: type II and III secretion system protein [Cyanobacteria bacterium SW_4_48_29]